MSNFGFDEPARQTPGSAPLREASSQAPVPEALNALNRAVSILDEVIGDLITQVKPACRVVDATATGVDPTPKGPHSELTANIIYETNRVNNLTDVLQALHKSLEL